MHITFRVADQNDVPAIVTLVESAYRGDASRAGWTTEADMLEGQRIDTDGVLADIQKTDSLIILAYAPTTSTSGALSLPKCSASISKQSAISELLACCHLEKTGDICYFGMFSVKPNQQGSGIGKLMMAEAERIASNQWQCTRMQMTVIDIRDSLIDFYLRRGYRRTGIHKPFPYGDERFGIPMRDDLRFEILEKILP